MQQEGGPLQIHFFNAAMVYIAPPDRHLRVNPDGSLSLSQSELVHFVRPSADLLFESAAASYQDRAIAVVLSGTASAPTNSITPMRSWESILTSLRSGVVMVDRQMNVLVWNRQAADLRGRRDDEVKGQSLLSLDSGHITCTPFLNTQGGCDGTVLLMEEVKA
jgi:PAS domain-containing protein